MAASDHISDIKGDPSHNAPGCAIKCQKNPSIGTNPEGAGHGNYRCRGYVTISNDSGKAERYKYDKAAVQALTSSRILDREMKIGSRRGQTQALSNPAQVVTAWDFGGTTATPRSKVKNFTKAYAPYSHNYHHMLPWSAINDCFPTINDLHLLQLSGWHLNDGINMIILPCYEQVARIMGMYTHPNNHPDYTNRVSTTINDVKRELAGDDSGHLKPGDFPNIKDTFEDWEKKEFWNIAGKGKTANAAHVNEHRVNPMKLRADALNKC